MLAEFSIYPLKAEQVSRAVAEVVVTLENAGLHYHLGPMHIAVEGTWEQMQEAIRCCHQLVALKHDDQPKYLELDSRNSIFLEKRQLRDDRNV
jgi:uncharacterized protein YqgV (UPF0045/DUF77 family)